MATKRKDWKAKWEAIAKENRKLAKRANQRLVRLERAAESREGYSSIKEFAYKVAQRDLRSLGKKGNKLRFTEAPRIVSINDGTKELTGADLYKANVERARNERKMLREFLSSASSTIGGSREYKAEGIKATQGITAIWDKVNQTINTKYLSEYELSMSDNDFKRFWDSKKQAKLEKIVGSTQMFAVASIMKKYNLKSSRAEIEKYAKDNIVLPSGTDPSVLDMRAKESRQQYLDRLDKFMKFSAKDEVLNDAVKRALAQGVDVTNIFI